MNQRLTIFNGEDPILLDRADLEKYRPTELVELFETTAVYRDLINDFIDQGTASGISFGGRKLNSKFILQVEQGFIGLYERMEEIFGQDAAALIWAKVANAINLEKCEE
jgi:hypothetical protein